MTENDTKNTENIKLSPKRELFCQELVKDENQTQAAIRAGYSKRSADQQGSFLMTYPEVRARVEQLRAERTKKNAKSANDLLKKLWDAVDFDPKKHFEIIQREITAIDHNTGEEITVYKNNILIKDIESLDGTLITKMKLDKNGNPAIETISKETSLRLLAEIYFKLKEDNTAKNVNITFGDKTAAEFIKSKMKKK